MPIKEKTKAKKRYLRKKKDRRKQKTRVWKTIGTGNDGQKAEVSGLDEEVEVDHASTKATTEQDIHPPKKRRRLRAPTDTDSMDVDLTDEHLTDSGQPNEEISSENDIPLSESVLPKFPLPVLPDPPSKVDLALQGLDQALVEAESIDSSHVLPIVAEDEEDTRLGLSVKMRRSLKDLGIQELFAVQTSLLPFLLQNSSHDCLYRPYDPPRDVCVSAPTGSGKTLAYAIPIVELLSMRVVTRLRALVILPTRDLVVQVRETFDAISKGRGLKIGIVAGQHSFAHEQSQLIADQSPHIRGGSSKIDILICTPGRLIDHLNGTPNFSLQHLRFLVIDEADRLLAQSFQDWLIHILDAIRPSRKTELGTTSHFPFIDGISPAHQHLLSLPELPTNLMEKRAISCQKLLFSATLTRDPGKTAALELRDPKYFVIQEREMGADGSGVLSLVMEKFSMPATLKEHMLVCESSMKPLMFFYLVHMRSVTNALVFTKSAESTTRLVRLFEYFEQSWSAATTTSSNSTLIACAYSSDLPVSERKTIFEKFKSREIHILVCSDLISRGIDIDHVSHVVSYDVPVDMRKYVHRVGRTARAGREGYAWTLVEEQEARYFKHMLQEAGHLGKVKRMRVPEKEAAPLIPHYEVALKRLKDVYMR